MHAIHVFMVVCTTDENDSCSVHHTCNMRNCSDISIAYAQYHRVESGLGA